LVASKAEEMLSPTTDGGDADDQSILRARLADLQTQPNLAIRHYRLALSINPWEIGWRLRLARLLRQQGRLSEADVEYSLLSQQAPERSDIRMERASLQLEIAEQKIRSGPSGRQP
jgi:Flp pilus assembly protein TadD